MFNARTCYIAELLIPFESEQNLKSKNQTLLFILRSGLKKTLL